MTVTHLAKQVATIGGALLVGWQLASVADGALLSHLDAKFATKADMSRIEGKIDSLTDAVLAREVPHPPRK